MADLKLKDVNLVMVDKRNQVRNSLRMALNDAGIHNNNITDGADLNTILESMKNSNMPDILICDIGTQDDDIVKTINAVRHQEVGLNPFVAIIAITWEPVADTIRKVAGSGADYILAAPFSPQQIFDRINSLVHNRAPFIVTSDYIGPERREQTREESEIPLIDVPNSLRDKVFGQFNEKVFLRHVNTTAGLINSQKMDRHANNLAQDAAIVADHYTVGGAGIDTGRLDRLQTSASELKWRASDAGYVHVVKLCDAIQAVIAKLRNASQGSPSKEIELLKQLSLAIRGSIDSDASTETLINYIAVAVTSRR